jgi:thiamine-phosphate pyrophosphorylase
MSSNPWNLIRLMPAKGSGSTIPRNDDGNEWVAVPYGNMRPLYFFKVRNRDECAAEGLRQADGDAEMNTRPALPAGIYGITAAELSRGRSNEQVVRAMIAGGIKVIQYRAKEAGLNNRRRLEECRVIRALTRDAGVMFIVNDHVELACRVDADGVHVGQGDLPVPAVRELVGEDKIIGLSTHTPEQARRAIELGVDYIGVGPVFATRTKVDALAPVGLPYVSFVARHIPLPFAAIGGIKAHNIREVAAGGAKTICLLSEIVGAEDITATVAYLTRLMDV